MCKCAEEGDKLKYTRHSFTKVMQWQMCKKSERVGRAPNGIPTELTPLGVSLVKNQWPSDSHGLRLTATKSPECREPK